jgi:putative ABC transport system permease protein
LYPEYVLTPDERHAFLSDKTGCIVGKKLATRFGWKVGDVITLQGTIYPMDAKLTIRAIYRPKEPATDATQLFFHWSYLNDSMPPGRQNVAGIFFVGVAEADRSPEVAKAIDTLFRDSPAETLTESERAFQLGFVSMAGTIMDALQIVSYFVLFIIALLLGNTIAMSVRERGAEVATLKALGFPGSRLAFLIAAESAFIGMMGGLLGIAATHFVVPAAGRMFDIYLGGFFRVFTLGGLTIALMLIASTAIGLVAAFIPAAQVARMSVAAAFRRIA